jgi:hypothetical protein
MVCVFACDGAGADDSRPVEDSGSSSRADGAVIDNPDAGGGDDGNGGGDDGDGGGDDADGGDGSCTPRTCEDAEASCGSAADGCGGVLECGECVFDRRCEQNVCVESDVMYVSLGNSAFQGDGDSFEDRGVFQNQVCFYRSLTAYPVCEELLLEEGRCRAIRFVPGTPCGPFNSLFQGDGGSVTVTGGDQSPNQFDPSPEACMRSDLPGNLEQLWSGGESLSIVSTGGADFPAFSTSVEAPAQPVIYTSAIQRGAPVDISWSPGTASAEVSVIVRTNSSSPEVITIFCIVPDTGTVHLSAAMTSLLDPTATGAFIRLDRNHRVHLEPPDRQVVIEVNAAASTSRNPAYTP